MESERPQPQSHSSEPPVTSTTIQSTYRHIFHLFNDGLSHDEKNHYAQAYELYVRGLKLVSRLLGQRDAYNSLNGLSSTQLSTLYKHRKMFEGRVKELHKMLSNHQAQSELSSPSISAQSARPATSGDKGSSWFQSVKDFFVPSSAETHSQAHAANVSQSRYQHQLHNQPQQQRVPNLSYIQASRSSPQQSRQHSYQSRSSSACRQTHSQSSDSPSKQSILSAPELRGIDHKLLNSLLDNVVEQHSDQSIDLNSIKGLNHAKQILKETLIFPQLRPDLFSGLRQPTKGILLYGPPGTGKTLLAKFVAYNVKATFFNISTSSLMSKYHGESEKIAHALFSLARFLAPSVIFIDEIDSVLGERGGSSEHEATRRLKTQFLIELDGIVSSGGDNNRVLILAATNRPQELDDAALRRFPKRIFVPLPGRKVRRDIIHGIMVKNEDNQIGLSRSDYDHLAEITKGFSGSDLKELCKEAIMMPLRELGENILTVNKSHLREVQAEDFKVALKRVRPSTNTGHLRKLEEWSKDHGTSG